MANESVDDLILMKILAKLLNNIKEDKTGNIHDAQCSTCGMKPIENLDRYHCLICSTSQFSYDLCGRCFEKRLFNQKHSTGHPFIHFKLPNEYLGIIVYDIKDVYLNEIRKLKTLTDERHDGIKCDGVCNQTNIKGLTFKCDTCHNYNLCDSCALIKQITTKNHQSDHPIILTSNKNIPKIDHNDIQLGQILGRGGFGMFSLFISIFIPSFYPPIFTRVDIVSIRLITCARCRIEFSSLDNSNGVQALFKNFYF